MKILYGIGLILPLSFITAMDKPQDRAALEKQAKELIRQSHHQAGLLGSLLSAIKSHKEERKNETPRVRELTLEEVAARDKVTLAPDGSIPLTLRECINEGITQDPRILEMAANDPFTKMSNALEKAGASDEVIAEVLQAKLEQQSNQKSASTSLVPFYNAWMKQFEEQPTIHEEDFNTWLGELCTAKATGKSVANLTYDQAGDTITTRVFLYRDTKGQPERATAGNLDFKRLADMQKLDELGLDFNQPNKNGQVPLNVALAHGRYQAASQLVLGTYSGHAFRNGPVKLKFDDKELSAKNPFLLTLIDSLDTSLKAYAYLKDGNGKTIVDESRSAYLKNQYLILAFYLLNKGAAHDYSDLKGIKTLSDPVEYAADKGFNKISSLILLERAGKLKSALELVGEDIAQADQVQVAHGIEPYRLI